VLDKCENPKCLAVFRRLGDGKLFRVPRVGTLSGPSGAVKKFVAMEHFWLCSNCDGTMTMAINRHGKVGVIPLPSARGSAAQGMIFRGTMPSAPSSEAPIG
jgi:hypothetical protein